MAYYQPIIDQLRVPPRQHMSAMPNDEEEEEAYLEVD